MRPPVAVMSVNSHVSCSTFYGSASTRIGARATSFSGV